MIRVRGPYWAATTQTWALKWVDDSSEAHVKTFRDKDECLKYKVELQGGQRELPLKPIKRFTGSATEFKRRISEAVIALNQAVRDGDANAVDLLRHYVRGLSEMAAAIVPHAGYLELEERHAELVKFVEDLFAGRATLDAAKPATLGSLAATLPSRSRSNQAVC